jgi:tetratricopeptide (TPR) repeat protein
MLCGIEAILQIVQYFFQSGFKLPERSSKEFELDVVRVSGGSASNVIVQRAREIVATDPESALKSLEEFLLHEPSSLEAMRIAADALMRLARHDEAVDFLNLALHYHPGDASAIRDKIRALMAGGEVSKAYRFLLEQFSVDPKAVDIGLLLAKLQYDAWDYDAARDTLAKLIESTPLQFDALNFLGLILAREYGELDRGQQLIAKALEVRSGDLSALSNMGWVLAEQGLLADAMACFDRVLAATPKDGETRLMRALANLKNGRYSEGWPDFEARFQSAAYRRCESTIPRLPLVEPVLGRRVLVTAEQGLGDQIMFASCLEDLRREVVDCVIECDSRLVAIFRRSFPGFEVMADSSPAGTRERVLERHLVSHEIAMGSLPGRYRLSRADFPAHAGFLKADPGRVARWQQKLEKLGPGPKIGVSWKGGAASTRRQLRSVSAAVLSSSMPAGANLISLQYGVGPDEVNRAALEAGRDIIHWPESIENYEDTAALILGLDLVISVCTAVVHLAGALGKEVWVLTPAIPEWRYQASGSEMPWYPSVKLFRQAPGESWQAVAGRVGNELKRRTF